LPLNERPIAAMNLLSRLFGKRPDEREALRPLWQRVVELARAKGWYARLGVADTMEGRFDMVSLVLASVLLRMEREPELAEAQARLTELFVDDMDGQLRQNGIGDPTVGKHVRKLVTTLGGRLGALRDALPQGEGALVPVLERNVTMLPGSDPASLASAVIALAAAIGDTQTGALLSGDFSFDPA
jgi:cytochrome b pre-mRNA-processing protein 3